MNFNHSQDNAKSYLEKVLAILDMEAAVLEEEIDESTICYRIECKAEDARLLIGRNGQTLEALQFIVRQMVRSNGVSQNAFLVDILDYRTRRKHSLEEQAKRAAVAVLNGDSDSFALPPMTAYERRVVHQFLHDEFPDLSTGSVGEGPDRHIVISFSGISGSRKQEEAAMTEPSEAEEPQS